jgi:hypothetical protein
MTESIEVSIKNLRYDIWSIIQKEFYLFIRENPTHYDEVDWNDTFTSYRFGLQSQIASKKIMDLPALNYFLKKEKNHEQQ